MKVKQIAFLTLFAASIISCSKKSDSVTPSTNTDLLSGGSSKTWKQYSETVNGISMTLPPCQVNKSFTFSSSKSFIYTAGPIKCFPSDTTYNGIWSLNSNQDSINLIKNGSYYSSKIRIVSLSSSNLIISFTFGSGSSLQTTQQTLTPQ